MNSLLEPHYLLHDNGENLMGFTRFKFGTKKLDNKYEFTVASKGYKLDEDISTIVARPYCASLTLPQSKRTNSKSRSMSVDPATSRSSSLICETPPPRLSRSPRLRTIFSGSMMDVDPLPAIPSSIASPTSKELQQHRIPGGNKKVALKDILNVFQLITLPESVVFEKLKMYGTDQKGMIIQKMMGLVKKANIITETREQEKKQEIEQREKEIEQREIEKKQSEKQIDELKQQLDDLKQQREPLKSLIYSLSPPKGERWGLVISYSCGLEMHLQMKTSKEIVAEMSKEPKDRKFQNMFMIKHDKGTSDIVSCWSVSNKPHSIVGEITNKVFFYYILLEIYKNFWLFLISFRNIQKLLAFFNYF